MMTLDRGQRQPRRVALFAFACDPDAGSEPGAGWAALKAAANAADEVVVVVGSYAPESLAPKAVELGTHVSVLRVTTWADRQRNVYLRYLAWVIAAARAAAKDSRFATANVVHHATFASDWFPSPLAFLTRGQLTGKTVIWGPVGGATYPPLRLVLHSGPKFLATEAARALLTKSGRLITRILQGRKVDKWVALNADTAHHFPPNANTIVRPNASLSVPKAVPHLADSGKPSAIFLGRGVRWKGLDYALAAMAHLPVDWTLDVYGPGTDAARYVAAAASLNGRVRFHGSVSRAEALDRVARSAVVFAPSLHDSAPWAVGEASALGVPVVCFDLGGVAAMAGPNALVVSRKVGGKRAARLLAEAAQSALSQRDQFQPWSEWSETNYAEFFRVLYEKRDS